jgi:hypothetical protein
MHRKDALGLRCVGLLRRFDLESPSSVVVQNLLYLRHVLDDTLQLGSRF